MVSPCTTAWLMRGPGLMRCMLIGLSGEVDCDGIATTDDHAYALSSRGRVARRQECRERYGTGRLSHQAHVRPKMLLRRADRILVDEHDALDPAAGDGIHGFAHAAG